jgi:drug/metabolite transporter (DMT)-like permease
MYNQALLCFVTVILWGINPILTRLGSNIIDIKPYMVATTIIQSIATCIIISIMKNDVWYLLEQGMFNIETMQKGGIIWLISLSDGILCLSIPFIIYNNLLSTTNSIALIVTTTWYGAPILTTILSYMIFHQELTKLQFGGIIVSIIGIIMLNIEDILKPSYEQINNV